MKTYFKDKRAFTLIELLIVIAIIGILFIVLVSKVDFATDKAKASGVQTDFRSFQVALDTVAKENAGFNTFGFNAGDNAGAIPSGYAFETTALKDATIGDGIRNSYDQGDKNLNGKQDTGEVFTGSKIYTEDWTEVYTLVKPGTTGLDANAVFALESAINANLDPKLHITINTTDGTIAMANQARDPWKNEYHGVYISNAERDNGADRGAIIIYSNGANGKWGSAHDISNGVVSVTVPGNNVNGKDDYSIVSCYTFTNGYGEVQNLTTGFSNNQTFNGQFLTPSPDITPDPDPDPDTPVETPDDSLESTTYQKIQLNTAYTAHATLLEEFVDYPVELTFVFFEDYCTFFVNGTHGLDNSQIAPWAQVEYYDDYALISTTLTVGGQTMVGDQSMIYTNEDGSELIFESLALCDYELSLSELVFTTNSNSLDVPTATPGNATMRQGVLFDHGMYNGNVLLVSNVFPQPQIVFYFDETPNNFVDYEFDTIDSQCVVLTQDKFDGYVSGDFVLNEEVIFASSEMAEYGITNYIPIVWLTDGQLVPFGFETSAGAVYIMISFE